MASNISKAINYLLFTNKNIDIYTKMSINSLLNQFEIDNNIIEKVRILNARIEKLEQKVKILETSNALVVVKNQNLPAIITSSFGK